MCPHRPECPSADRPDHDAAVIVSAHPEQGWYRLCNVGPVVERTGADTGMYVSCRRLRQSVAGGPVTCAHPPR
ncbi:DUF5999 family protein, partial [Streptomyces sp. NPDC058960]